MISEHPERSDAGTSIVQEVFGFVRETYPQWSEGRVPLAEKGARGKGRQPLSPPQPAVTPKREQRFGFKSNFRKRHGEFIHKYPF
jgi:hypothetical protein